MKPEQEQDWKSLVRGRLQSEAYDRVMVSRIEASVRSRRRMIAAWMGGGVLSLVMAVPILVPEWRWDLGNLMNDGQTVARVALDLSEGRTPEE